MTRNLLSLTCLVAVVGLAACGTSSTKPHQMDPWEGYNRAMFQVNDTVDRVMFKPLAQGYRYVTPDPVETGVSNFFGNLMYPRTVFNQALQGKFKLAAEDTGRFLVNSTLGWLGVFDPASALGLEKHDEDFGQTLAVWGVGSGPYVVLPLLGPSTVRGTAGWVGDHFTSPITYVDDNETRYSLMGLNIIQTRASMLKAESLLGGDKYLFMRDAYLQRREHLIHDAQAEAMDPFLIDEE